MEIILVRSRKKKSHVHNLEYTRIGIENSMAEKQLKMPL